MVYLEKADFQIKEEVVLKVAVLAERHAADFEWYVLSPPKSH